MLLLVPQLCFSQEKGSIKINVFKPQDNVPTATNSSPGGLNRHNIKWNYSLLGRGVFLMNYEFYLSDKFTGEVGVGLSYRDFIFEFSDDLKPFVNYTTPNVNFCGEAGFRFYPKGFADFEGVYLSPVISYRNYTFKENLSSSSINSATILESKNGYNFIDLQFKFGYQYESLWSDLYADLYIGLALRNLTQTYDVSTVDMNGTYYKVPVKESKSYPQALVGIKLGLPF